MKGAFPFLVLFGLKYGPENIFIISRVNHLPRGDSKHWVNKFVESIGIAEFPRGLGVPEENVRLVTERHGPFGKGPVCKEYGITHYIDDEPDCLWSFWADECGHAAEPVAAFYFDEWRHWRGHSALKSGTPGINLHRVSTWQEPGGFFRAGA